MLQVLDLFSGIGGFSLGLERAGMKTVAFCEIDPYCRSVLAKHWPQTYIFEDVTTLSSQHLTAAGIAVDVICGGFPCQDISRAGARAGLDGDRSGLWREYARLIGELEPRYVIVENVAALLERGIERVLGDLSDLGYDADWSIVSACAVGAPHMRQRVFIVAYPNGVDGRQGLRHPNARPIQAVQALHDFEGARTRWKARLEDPSSLYGGADGLSRGMDRNRGLGNAITPQIPELIGRAILAAEAKA